MQGFFFKQSCNFLNTESRALTGCAIPCSKSIRELEAHESARGTGSSVGDLDKSCFAFLSVQLSYQSYSVCVRCMYKIEKKKHCILCSKTTCLEEVKAETNKS